MSGEAGVHAARRRGGTGRDGAAQASVAPDAGGQPRRRGPAHHARSRARAPPRSVASPPQPRSPTTIAVVPPASGRRFPGRHRRPPFPIPRPRPRPSHASRTGRPGAVHRRCRGRPLADIGHPESDGIPRAIGPAGLAPSGPGPDARARCRAIAGRKIPTGTPREASWLLASCAPPGDLGRHFEALLRGNTTGRRAASCLPWGRRGAGSRPLARYLRPAAHPPPYRTP